MSKWNRDFPAIEKKETERFKAYLKSFDKSFADMTARIEAITIDQLLREAKRKGIK